VDDLVGASVKYWNVAPVTPGANVTVSPVATLAEAYRRYMCSSSPADCKTLDNPAVFDDVYALFGFSAQSGITYRGWDGIIMGTKFGLSIYVLNQRVASVLTAASEAVNAMCEGFDSSSNVHVQLAVQYALVEMLLAQDSASERMASLSNPIDIATVIEGSLANLQTPEADLRTCKTLSPADRAALFAVIAKVCFVWGGVGWGGAAGWRGARWFAGCYFLHTSCLHVIQSSLNHHHATPKHNRVLPTSMPVWLSFPATPKSSM